MFPLRMLKLVPRFLVSCLVGMTIENLTLKSYHLMAEVQMQTLLGITAPENLCSLTFKLIFFPFFYNCYQIKHMVPLLGSQIGQSLLSQPRAYSSHVNTDKNETKFWIVAVQALFNDQRMENRGLSSQTNFLPQCQVGFAFKR